MPSIEELKAKKNQLLDRLLCTVVPPDQNLVAYRLDLLDRIEEVSAEIAEEEAKDSEQSKT